MPGKPFCPVCGKKMEKWGICQQCQKSLESKKILLRVCLRCKHYLDRGKWKQFDSFESLKKEFDSKGIKVSFKKGLCEPCRRFLSGYYEALIQLRTKNQKVYDLLVKKLEENKSRDRNAFYRMKARKDGMDFEVGRRSSAVKAIRSLSTFHVSVRKEIRVVGVKKGKRIARDVFVVR